ncbi:MAG: acyltransferase [Dermatophilaceae bacterium]
MAIIERGAARIRTLDGVRAVAVLATSLVHVAREHVGGGFVGVDVFFVLSGFLITSLLLEEHALGGHLDLRRFYGRRARRLMPAVVGVLAVFVVVTLLDQPTPRSALVAAVVVAAVLLYVFNWTTVVGHEPPWQTDHLWSLSVEGQFYAVWPLVLRPLLRLRRGTVLAVLALATAVAAAAQAIGFLVTGSVAAAYLATPLHAQGILLGCLIAAAVTWGAADRLVAALTDRQWPVWLSLAVLGTLAVALNQDAGATYLFGISLAVVATGVILMALVGRAQAGSVDMPVRLFGNRLLVGIGERSYSIYIWQNFVAWALTPMFRQSVFWLPANLALTAVCAELSFRFVERRFLRPGLARVAGPPAASASTG